MYKGIFIGIDNLSPDGQDCIGDGEAVICYKCVDDLGTNTEDINNDEIEGRINTFIANFGIAMSEGEIDWFRRGGYHLNNMRASRLLGYLMTNRESGNYVTIRDVYYSWPVYFSRRYSIATQFLRELACKMNLDITHLNAIHDDGKGKYQAFSLYSF